MTVSAQWLPGPTAGHTGSKGLSFNMKQKLWTLAFALALLDALLHFFHGTMDRDGTVETQGQIPTRINLTTPQSPVRRSVKFSYNLVEEPHFLQPQY